MFDLYLMTDLLISTNLLCLQRKHKQSTDLYNGGKLLCTLAQKEDVIIIAIHVCEPTTSWSRYMTLQYVTLYNSQPRVTAKWGGYRSPDRSITKLDKLGWWGVAVESRYEVTPRVEGIPPPSVFFSFLGLLVFFVSLLCVCHMLHELL